ncbi:MAG: inositol monophosphatase family protein [Bacteroidota bacterium]
MTIKNKNLDIALEAAWAGARVVLQNFDKSKDFQVKGNSKGLVTQTDLQAEKAILDLLLAKSDYKILSEESGSLGRNEGPVWVVDPLDGTNNFARSLPFFAVSVGLMDRAESLVGVIIDPVQNKEYYAAKGEGAFCNGERLQLTKFNTDYIPMLFLNHGYAETDRKKFEDLSKLLASTHNILKLGTTALELCYLANGSGDGFICSGDELWDFAAGIVIAQEAGCIFTDWQGNPWDGKNEHILFARPEVHADLVKTIKDLQK